MNYENQPRNHESTDNLLSRLGVDVYETLPERWIGPEDDSFNHDLLDPAVSIKLGDVNEVFVSSMNKNIGEGFWGLMSTTGSDGSPSEDLMDVIYRPIEDRLEPITGKLDDGINPSKIDIRNSRFVTIGKRVGNFVGIKGGGQTVESKRPDLKVIKGDNSDA